MSDNQDVLDFLRERFKRADDKLDRLGADMLEVKERLGFLEGVYASVSRRIDRIDQRLERIERRLDLVGTL